MPSFGCFTRKGLLSLLSAGCAALMLGCSGGGGGGNTPPPPTPDFTLSVASPQNIQAGASGPATVSAARSGGHTAAINLSVASNAQSISGTGSIAVAATSGILTLAVPAGVSAGSSTLTVNGTDGTLTRAATVVLTVTPAPDFSLSVAPPPSIPAGGSGSTAVSVTRTGGHTVAITLSLVSNAQGITGSGTIASGASSGTLTVNVPGTVGTSTYALSASGADGTLTHTTAFSLTVIPAPDFSLAVAPPPSIHAGGNGGTAVNVTRSGGHTASITLSLASNGQGITGSGTIASGADSGTLSINVPGAVGAGTYTLSASGTDGALIHTAAFSLTVIPAPDFSLSVAPPLSIQAGSGGSTTVNVTRTGGHTAAINLDIALNAQGITGSGTIAASATSGNLSLAVPVGLTPANYPLTCDGDDGTRSRSTGFNLTVAAPPAFTLGLSASSVSTILGGTTAPLSLTLTRSSGFIASVSFSILGVPTGVSAVFTPASTTGNTATLDLAASVSAITGTTALTVRTSGGGVTQDVPLSFTLNPVPSTPMALSTWVNGVQANTTWFAWRDGQNGAWTVLTGSTGGYGFTVTDPAGRFSYAAAFAGDATTGPQVKVIHMTVGELATPLATPEFAQALAVTSLSMTFGTQYPTSTSGTTVTGEVLRSLPNTTYEMVLMSLSSEPQQTIFPTGNPPSYSASVPQGNYTGVVVERDATTSAGLNAAVLGSTSLTGTNSILNIDRGIGFFPLQPMVIPVQAPYPFGGLAVQAELVPMNSSDNPATFLYLGVLGLTFTPGFFPSSHLPPGGIHRLDGIAFSSDYSQASFQTQFMLYPPTVPNPVVIPPLLTGVHVTTAAGASGQLCRVVGDVLLPVRDSSIFLVRSSFSQFRVSGLPLTREDLYTRSWLDPGASPTTGFTTDDLAGLPGWIPAWNITPGVQVNSGTSVFASPNPMTTLLPFLTRTIAVDGLTFNAQNWNLNFIP